MFSFINIMKPFKTNSVIDEDITPVTMVDDIFPTKIEDMIDSIDSNVCVTPFRTKINKQKEMSVIIVDKYANKKTEVHLPSKGIICRFKELKYVDDGMWTPYFNLNLIGIDDYTYLNVNVLEINVTRFISTNNVFYIFGENYVNIELLSEVVFSYLEEDDISSGTVRGTIQRDKDGYYKCKLDDITFDGKNIEHLLLPKFNGSLAV